MIDLLTPDTIESVRSTIVIPTFAAAIRELIQNSLDASASDIEVNLRYTPDDIEIRVTDDGCGMSRAELSQVDSRYARPTTTLPSLRSHGKRGEALASLAHLGHLQIKSGPSNGGPAHRITFHNGKKTFARFDNNALCGTTVTLKHLFHKIPVRRSAALTNEIQTLASIRKVFEIAALSAPRCKMRLIKTLHGELGGASVICTSPGNSDAKGVFRALYGTDLIQVVERLHGAFALQGARVDGFMSLSGSTTSRYQFLYINGHYSPESIVAKTLVERFKGGEMSAVLDRLSCSTRSHTSRKPEIHPVFVLDISISDILTESQAVNLVNAICSRFKLKHGIKPHNSSAASQISFKKPSPQPAATLGSLKLPATVVALRSSKTTSVSPASGTECASVKVRQSLSSTHLLPSPRPKGKWLDNALRSLPAESIIRPAAASGASVRTAALKRLSSAATGNEVDFQAVIKQQDLRTASVIAQVASKFILCRLQPTSDSPPLLILVDQHAASERIRIEKMLGEIIDAFLTDGMEKHSPSSEVIVSFTAPRQASLGNGACVALLARWGVVLCPSSPCSAEHTVINVPKIFKARLAVKDSQELSTLVSDVLDYWEQHGRDSLEHDILSGSITKRQAHTMIPKEIIELANSAACRGAIMFGDQLTLDECSALVSDLARADFPFICAHGRPSMVPIASLSNVRPARSVNCTLN